MRVVVIGAGPTGIAAALGAMARGHETTVLEAETVGASLLRWGPTRFFTPLAMNVTPAMREAARLPPDDALLSGPEYVEQVLVPVAQRLPIRTNTRVAAISRRGLTRMDYAGHPIRAEKPFRVVTSDDDVIECDLVLDATGSTATPLPYATRGQSQIEAIRSLDALDARKNELQGKRVLLVGNGHSAANAIAVLRKIDADVTWVVRTPNQRPVEDIANDPLPERKRVVAFANDCASQVRVERRATVERVARNNGHIDVAISGNRSAQVDAIVALTGYRPNADFTSELALEISPVNEGGARLYRAISNITDCLCTPKTSNDDLSSGEPNYFFIGARAYGRSRTFLLQTGFAQVETILDSLS